VLTAVMLDRIFLHSIIVKIKGTQTVISRNSPGVVASRRRVTGGSGIGELVKLNPQTDSDVVTGDRDLFDHEADQLLTLREAEIAEGATDSVCEASYSAAKLVMLHERAALFNQNMALLLKDVSSGRSP
jgi:hypothetical protein